MCLCVLTQGCARPWCPLPARTCPCMYHMSTLLSSVHPWDVWHSWGLECGKGRECKHLDGELNLLLGYSRQFISIMHP